MNIGTIIHQMSEIRDTGKSYRHVLLLRGVRRRNLLIYVETMALLSCSIVPDQGNSTSKRTAEAKIWGRLSFFLSLYAKGIVGREGGETLVGSRLESALAEKNAFSMAVEMMGEILPPQSW